jgi:glutamate formiminotransferase/formiminotetrahydrofolate cyclodeaminase
MQMDAFEPDQVLETRLFEKGFKPTCEDAALPESSFLDDLASGKPTPGGGSASAYGAAIAASLVAMVGRLTVGKKKYADVEGEIWQVVEQAVELQQAMKNAVAKDADAFEAYMKARRLPKDTDQQKSDCIQAIRAASINAAEVPLHVARNALTIMRLALRTAELGNVNAVTDAGTAVSFAAAAISGAGLNVRVNLLGLERETDPARMLNELKKIEKQAEQVKSDLKEVLKQRGGLNLP